MDDTCGQCGAARTYGAASCPKCGHAYGSQWHDQAIGPLARRQLAILGLVFLGLAVAWVAIFGHP